MLQCRQLLPRFADLGGRIPSSMPGPHREWNVPAPAERAAHAVQGLLTTQKGRNCSSNPETLPPLPFLSWISILISSKIPFFYSPTLLNLLYDFGLFPFLITQFSSPQFIT